MIVEGRKAADISNHDPTEFRLYQGNLNAKERTVFSSTPIREIQALLLVSLLPKGWELKDNFKQNDENIRREGIEVFNRLGFIFESSTNNGVSFDPSLNLVSEQITWRPDESPKISETDDGCSLIIGNPLFGVVDLSLEPTVYRPTAIRFGFQKIPGGDVCLFNRDVLICSIDIVDTRDEAEVLGGLIDDSRLDSQQFREWLIHIRQRASGISDI